MKRRTRGWTVMSVLFPCIAWGLYVEVPPMPPKYADTETSTNIVFSSERSDVRDLNMHFYFEGLSSNCIQVAFGRDVDGDGTLSFGETDTVYGWRNGRYFAEDIRSGTRTEETESVSGDSLGVRMRMTKMVNPTLFTATNGTGGSVLGSLSSTVPTWLYRPEWNLMRVTRRGPGDSSEWFVCDIRYGDTYILIR